MAAWAPTYMWLGVLEQLSLAFFLKPSQFSSIGSSRVLGQPPGTQKEGSKLCTHSPCGHVPPAISHLQVSLFSYQQQKKINQLFKNSRGLPPEALAMDIVVKCRQ